MDSVPGFHKGVDSSYESSNDGKPSIPSGNGARMQSESTDALSVSWLDPTAMEADAPGSKLTELSRLPLIQTDPFTWGAAMSSLVVYMVTHYSMCSSISEVKHPVGENIHISE